MICDIAGEFQVTGFLLTVVRGYHLVNVNGTTSIRKGKGSTAPSSHPKARSKKTT